MKNDKSKKIIVVILIIVIIILVALVILFASNVTNLKNYNNFDNENNIIENQEINQNVITNNLTLLADECVNGCSKTINNKNGDSILFINSNEIKLDNKEILKFKEGAYSLLQVNVYNDIIITLQTFSLSSSMIIYDFSGNIIKEIGLFYDSQGRMFSVYPNYKQDKHFNVSDDGIISFTGTKHIQGSANTYIDNGGNTIDLCTQGENINNDEIISGIFKMAYLETNSFSEISHVSTKTTVKDIKSCN